MWHSDTLGVIRTPKEITVNGVTHPRQIFRKWSKAQLAELGITPARVETPDQRYYNTGAETLTLVDGETVISYAGTEKNAEDLKTQIISQIKSYVSSTLSSSDWRVIRAQEGYKVAGQDWTDYRSSVRDHGNALEVEVNAITDMDGVKAFQNHAVTEVRYTSTYDAEGKETIGPETEEVSRSVDKANWNWPSAPDAEADPYHVNYK